MECNPSEGKWRHIPIVRERAAKRRAFRLRVRAGRVGTADAKHYLRGVLDRDRFVAKLEAEGLSLSEWLGPDDEWTDCRLEPNCPTVLESVSL